MMTLFFLFLGLFGYILNTNNPEKTQKLQTALSACRDSLSIYLDSLDLVNTTTQKLKEINRLDEAIKSLPPAYLQYDPKVKRYRIPIEIRFARNSSDISTISESSLTRFEITGRLIQQKLDSITKYNSKIEYLIIIEGSAARNEVLKNYMNDPIRGYQLSYDRALALKNFWASKGIRPYDNPNIELLVSGSGYFSKSRDVMVNENNRRFIVHLIPKVGEYLVSNDE